MILVSSLTRPQILQNKGNMLQEEEMKTMFQLPYDINLQLPLFINCRVLVIPTMQDSCNCGPLELCNALLMIQLMESVILPP